MGKRKVANDDRHFFQQALDLRGSGDHAAAVKILAQLISQDSNNIDALFLLGASLFSLDRSQEAARAFREVLKLRPKNEPASLGLFHSLWKLGDRQGAYQEMRRFLSIADSREYEQLLADVDAAFEEAPE